MRLVCWLTERSLTMGGIVMCKHASLTRTDYQCQIILQQKWIGLENITVKQYPQYKVFTTLVIYVTQVTDKVYLQLRTRSGCWLIIQSRVLLHVCLAVSTIPCPHGHVVVVVVDVVVLLFGLPV